MNKESKNFEFKAVDDEKGSVEAVFSVFNNMDTDGDVMVPGSIKSGFKDNQVPMVFAHKWDQPIGKGVISQDENKAVFKGSFFMDTEAGKEAYALAKGMGDLQEWSFGFRIDDSEVKGFLPDGTEEEIEARYIKSATVYEVSPVLVGANRETYTLAIKSGEDAIYESENISEEKAANDEDIFDNQEDAAKRAEELGCSGTHIHEMDGKEVYMPCATHESYEAMISNDSKSSEDEEEEEVKYGKCSYGTDGKCAKDEKEKSLNSVEVKSSEEDSGIDTGMTGMRFSDEVKDVLAALESLIVRATSISELRKGEGRKLSDNATSALRAVQEDLNDAWAELDQLIEDVAEVPAETEEEKTEDPAPEAEATETEEIVSEVEESSTEEEVEEVPVDEVQVDSEAEEVQAEEEDSEEIAEAEAEVIEDVDAIEEEDSELFAEIQQTLAEAAVAELDE